ncbi:MAG: manganese efflux pump MntP family protein [Bacilli bacterium]|nr:manganese efflux pump MntP family protein [Bacilli bacterium]
MQEIISIIVIGIALSMDTFSLALGVGMMNYGSKKALKLSSIVGIMHFVMPFIGMMIGSKIIKTFELKCDIILGIILIFIGIKIVIDLIKQEEESWNLTFSGMILFGLAVSMDSFSVGIGIKAITSNIYLAMTIFALCSFIFTYMGVVIGRQANKILGTYANILGAIILFILGFVHLI